MDPRIKSLIDFTYKRIGLENYYLKRYTLNRDINLFNETVYTLNMEWFPSDIPEHEDDDFNPAGTAVVNIEVHSRKFKSIIFVKGQSFATGIKFSANDKNRMIHWIENETDLSYGEQFQLRKEQAGELYFQGSVNGIPFSPSLSIELRMDSIGNLTFFSILGDYPTGNMVNEETFSLTIDGARDIVLDQLKLVKFPSTEQQCLTPAYAIEEIYITNNPKSTLPFDFVESINSRIELNQLLDWEPILGRVKPFELNKLT